MTDYIKTLNYITDTLTTPTFTVSLISAIIIILFLVIPIILTCFFGSRILSLFSAICLLIYGSMYIFPTNTTLQPVNTKVLKGQNITETIDENLLNQAYNIHSMGTKSLAYKDNDTNKYNDFKLSAILDHLNIKSINNLCSNIIYLDDYYTCHYYDQSKYDWINQKLNEFYKPSNDSNVSTDEILSNLKN